LFRQLHDQSRVLWDDTTQNNQYLIEIQKLNNKIMLRAKVSQWASWPPFRSKAALHLRCCSRVKNLSLAKKTPLAGVAATWASATQRNAYFTPCSGAIRRKIPVRHLILFKFLSSRGWRTMRLIAVIPDCWLMLLSNFTRLESLPRAEVVLVLAGRR
jgi:hypothetical protein